MSTLTTVKDAVTQASLELGITQRAITSAVSSADQDIVQMVALMSAVADETLSNEPYKVTLGDGMWLTNAAGATFDRPSQDTDVIMFDARLMVCGLKWRFLKQKGLEYGEEMRDYTARMNHLAGKANARVLDLNEDEERQQ